MARQRIPIFGCGRGLAAILCTLLAGCHTAPRPLTSSPGDPGAPVLSASYIFGPFSGDGEAELLSLQEGPLSHNAGRLRRAWILLQTRRPQAGIDAASLVLFGAETPSPPEQAYARYLRAEGYAALGDATRANFERTRARELALDPQLRARLEATPLPPHAASPVATPGVAMPMQRRASWNPAPTHANLDPMGRVWRVTVHHSAMYFRDGSVAAAAAQVRQIQREHMVDRGYADIGYHYLIDPSGRVWEGRDLRWQGAHARGDHNKGNIGICVLGNFVRGSGGQAPTEAQDRSLAALLGQVMQSFSIPVEEVHTHRDFVQTECPGAQLQAVVDRIVRDARRPGGRVAAKE